MKDRTNNKYEVSYMDVPSLSNLAKVLRNANEVFTDRQVRVKLEAYKFDKNAALETPRNKRQSIQEENIPMNGRNDKLTIHIGDDEHKSSFENAGEEGDDVEDARRGEPDYDEVFDDAETPTKKRRVSNDSTGVICQFNDLNIWRGKHPRRGLFKLLVQTLNSSFYEYDFSSVHQDQFIRRNLNTVIESVKARFCELSTVNQEEESPMMKTVLTDLWNEIDKLVGQDNYIEAYRLAAKAAGSNNIFGSDEEDVEVNQDTFKELLLGVEVYSYVPEKQVEVDADPLSSLGSLWAMNYFFCNPKLGKVVMFACSCRQRKFSQEGETKAMKLLAVSGEASVEHQLFVDTWEEDEEGSALVDLETSQILTF